MTGKFFKPDEIRLERPLGEASKEKTLEYLTKELFGPSQHPTPVMIDFNDPDDKPFTQAEIHTALCSLNVKKAPGPDCIDFRQLRLVFEAIPKVITRWANLCLEQNYFPLCLRQGEVVYFLKQGKTPSEPKSYRPICLLPTLGKLLEKLLVNRLTHHLETNNLLHAHQFGFRENHSCDKALDTILKTCNDLITAGNYTTLVSLDIQGAFDNVEWQDLRRELAHNHCPKNVAGTISSYLSERSVLINWGAGNSVHPLQKGCPQGSCLGPILWLLIANKILKTLTDAGHTAYAFADDFSIILSGQRRLDIEQQAKTVFPMFCQLLENLSLKLSAAKTKSVTFSKPHNLKRPPVIRINNVLVNHNRQKSILHRTYKSIKTQTHRLLSQYLQNDG